MGVQKNIKKLQDQVEILGGALTRTLKDLEQVTTLAQGTLTAFQLHIGEDKWKELVKQLKDLENKNVEQELEKGD
jgi:DNA-binding HxlR family transcriptional regulator